MAKNMIKCSSCGKSYDYLESESCPHCGAFNYDGKVESHVCDSEDIRDILEFSDTTHSEQERPRSSLNEMYGSKEGNIWERYAASKGRSTGRSQTNSSSEGYYAPEPQPATRRRGPDLDKKQRKGCTPRFAIGSIILGVLAFNIFFSVAFGLFQLFTNSISEPDIPPANSAQDSFNYTYNWGGGENSLEGNAIAAGLGRAYIVGNSNFRVDDVVLIDVPSNEEGFVVVGVKIYAAAGSGDPSSASYTASLVTRTEDATGQVYRHSEVNMLDSTMENSINSVFGDYYLDFLQSYEISFLSPGSYATGYIPFVVETETLDDLNLELEVSYNKNGNNVTEYYVYTLEKPTRHISLEIVRSTYKNTDSLLSDLDF